MSKASDHRDGRPDYECDDRRDLPEPRSGEGADRENGSTTATITMVSAAIPSLLRRGFIGGRGVVTQAG